MVIRLWIGKIFSRGHFSMFGLFSSCGLFLFPVSAAAAGFTEANIRASRFVQKVTGNLPDTGAQAAAQLELNDLQLVVMGGGHDIIIFDGEQLTPVQRIHKRSALVGDPQRTRDGRFAYFATRDGWISKFDLRQRRTVAGIRVGDVCNHLLISGDGKVLVAASDAPGSIVLVDADLNLLKTHAAISKDGKTHSSVAAIHHAAPRRSFIVALADVPEIWEISYNPTADDVPVGMIHDFQYKEGSFVSGFLNPRRTILSAPMVDFFLAPGSNELIGKQRGNPMAQVVHLDVRKVIAEINGPGTPQLCCAANASWNGKRVAAMRSRQDGFVALIDADEWKVIKTIAVPGAGRFLQSHAATSYIWTDSGAGKTPDTLLAFDTSPMEKASELRPAPGREIASFTFTHDG